MPYATGRKPYIIVADVSLGASGWKSVPVAAALVLMGIALYAVVRAWSGKKRLN